MPSARRLTPLRLATIYTRQANPTWDNQYVPSILAIRGEAPSISNIYAVKSPKFGRLVHLLSTQEFSAYLVAAYHPGLIGLQEQRMLSPEPRCHPLCNMPGEVPTNYPAFKGIIDVADRLGYLSCLPKIWAPATTPLGEPTLVVFPYTGDLLLAMRTGEGQAQCINWSIKADEAGFKRPIAKVGTSLPQSPEGILARYEIERTYYADAGIQTHLVVGTSFDTGVVNNLRVLYAYECTPLAMAEDERLELESRFQSCLESEQPISNLLPRLLGSGRRGLNDMLACFYQAIWQRRLRVDLFRPVLIDRPLHPETRDVVDVYAKLFQGAAKCVSVAE